MTNTGSLTLLLVCAYSYEPHHDKTNKMRVRPAKTQISLGVRPVWSESSLCAQSVAKDPRFLHADSEDSGCGWPGWCGCPGWSESSLGAQPFCWFCHVAAHIASWSESLKCDFNICALTTFVSLTTLISVCYQVLPNTLHMTCCGLSTAIHYLCLAAIHSLLTADASRAAAVSGERMCTKTE